MDNLVASIYSALWFETGGLFDPTDPRCVDGTDRRKCGTSGGPLDRGGNTKFGIAANSHPGIDIDGLTLDDACSIYKNKYWGPCKCDLMPEDIGSYVFDISCGSGVRVSSRLLQKSLGVNPDGVIGPLTLGAISKLDESDLLEKLRMVRLDFYDSIVIKNPSQSVFMPGWTRRANTFMDRVKIYRGA